MTDRELLELAAKAAGIDWFPANTEKGIELEPVFGLWLKIHGEPYQGQRRRWNPLTDDGDALRLAIDLQLGISIPPVIDGRVDVVTFYGPLISVIEFPVSGDRRAATRRAITRAAAEIQLAKESGK